MFCLMYSMFISTHVEVVFGSLKNCQLCLSYFGEGIEASTQRINQWCVQLAQDVDINKRPYQ